MIKKTLIVLLIFSLLSCKNSKLSATHSVKNSSSGPDSSGPVPTNILDYKGTKGGDTWNVAAPPALNKTGLDLDKNPGLGSFEVETRKKQLKELFSEEQFKYITQGSNNSACWEQYVSGSWLESQHKPTLPLPKGLNNTWYFTYDNFIKAMAMMPFFAGEGTYRTRLLELAAFFAEMSQETGADPSVSPFTGGCAIMEGYGAYWNSPNYNNPPGSTDPRFAKAGYGGRGPIQLSYSYNYEGFRDYLIQRHMIVKDSNQDPFKNPDILVTDPIIGILGSLWFWMHEDRTNGDLAPRVPFKPAIHDVIVGNWGPTQLDVGFNRTLDKAYGVITNIVNGLDPTAEQRAKAFIKIAQVLGVNITDPITNLTVSGMQNFVSASSCDAGSPSGTGACNTFPAGKPITQGSNSPDAQKRAPYRTAAKYTGGNVPSNYN